METEQLTAPGGCPPHHWLIANSATEQGMVERWSCQRCDATRERLLSRRRPLFQAPKRYVGNGEHAANDLFAPSGERVA